MRALELAAVLDDDFLGGLARVGANSLDLEEKIEKNQHMSKSTTVEVNCGNKNCQIKLISIICYAPKDGCVRFKYHHIWKIQ